MKDYVRDEREQMKESIREAENRLRWIEDPAARRVLEQEIFEKNSQLVNMR